MGKNENPFLQKHFPGVWLRYASSVGRKASLHAVPCILTVTGTVPGNLPSPNPFIHLLKISPPHKRTNHSPLSLAKLKTALSEWRRMTPAGWLAAMDALAFFKTVLRSTCCLPTVAVPCSSESCGLGWRWHGSVIKRCGNCDGKQLFVNWGWLVL